MIRSYPALIVCLSACLPASAAERTIRFTAPNGLLPAMKAVVVVKADAPGPGAPKHEAVASAPKYGEMLNLTSDGPFDVWWQPAEGVAVKAVVGLKRADGVRDVDLGEYLGVVRLRGDGLPRASLVTITAQDDPGPDEKGHVPVQKATDYRTDMVVPPGFYALWVTPENGARPRKVNDRFRVQAGRVTQLD